MSDEPKRYHHGDLRRALMDAALGVLAEGAGWQFTLREIARRAGVSHSAAYKHFPDKAALLSELAAIGFERMRADLLASQPGASEASRELFFDLARAYVGFGIANRNLYRLMFSTDARQIANTRRDDRGEAALDVLIEFIEAGQRSASLRAGDSRELAGAGWAHLHGLTMLMIDDLLGPKVGPNACEAAITVLWHGLVGSHER
jgi:AcrR family transcriptional regulator